MNAHWLGGRIFRLSAALMVAGALVGTAPGIASASGCVSWTGTQPANPSSSGDVLAGVDVLSACNVWAVGYDGGKLSQTLVEHWNGLAWTTMPSADPGGSHQNSLSAVAATSSTKAWAVGDYDTSSGSQTLIETLIAGVWEQESSPDPGGPARTNLLNGVAATSATNAWAVGTYDTGTAYVTLIERWNGAVWRQVPTPSPSGSNAQLLGVTATSARNAWAVGYAMNSHDVFQTLIEHWNGTAWKRVRSPNPSGASSSNELVAVAARSASNAWAVGTYYKGGTERALIERWNGKAWKSVPGPSLGHSVVGSALSGVTVLSAADAWAVGNYTDGEFHTLTERWNGAAWRRVPSPNPGSFNALFGVAASSPATIWAVGDYNTGSSGLTLAIHCC